MKIGIDARLYTAAGPGRYISNLIKELEKIDTENDYVIFVTKKGSEEYHPKNPKFKKWIADYKEYTFSEQTMFPLELMRAGLDLLHVPHFNIPVLYPKKTVVTIHDLIMSSDNSAYSAGSADASPLKKLGYKFVTNISSIRPQKIIVPSSKTKDDILERLKFAEEEKIVITYEGVDDELMKFKEKDDRVIKTRLEEMMIRKQYFLFVGSAYSHKNLNTLIVSYKEMLEEGKFNGQLVLAGKVDKFSQRTAGYVHALHLDDNIIFAAKYTEDNKITDKDLAYLYAGALAYVFPSLNEGFSITPLEAQAFGVPVALSDIPTHREVFGDSVLYFDPKSNSDLTNKMYEILKNEELRQNLIKAGLENVKKYSWSIMAKKTLEIYKSCMV